MRGTSMEGWGQTLLIRPSTAHTAHSRPDCIPQGRAHCPLLGPGGLVPPACLHIESVPVSMTRAF
jgi:hypothetical protein